MENIEKNGTKGNRNRIILKNLSKNQKEVLTSVGIIGGGIGLGAGLFSLYSMKNPETIPGLTPDETTAFNTQEVADGAQNSPIEIITTNPVAMINDSNISFNDAFKTAREINGPGGWFIWKDNIYNTYYKEEWQSLSQEERKDYLASLDVQSPEDSNKAEGNSTMADLGNNIDPSEGNSATSEDSNHIAQEEYFVDFSVQNKSHEDNTTHQTLEATQKIEQYDQTGDVLSGEIITLDDDTEISDSEYFELPDDVEIITISEDESSFIDSTTFDSSEITEFPWDLSNDNLVSNDEEVISVDFEDDHHDYQTTGNLSPQQEYPLGETDEKNEETNEETSFHIENHEENSDAKITEEYPWGEPVVKTTESILEPNLQVENIQEVQSNVINDPNEIKEYPWGEPIESVGNNLIQNDTETSLGEIHEVNADNSTPEKLNVIEEYPWGEPVVKTNVTISESNIQVENIQEVQSNVINDPNEIKEYPWGEKIETTEQNLTQNESVTILGEIHDTLDQKNINDKFSDIEEFPWGEKNAYFDPSLRNQVAYHEDESFNQINEEENIGVIILPDESDAEILNQLPPSFNDITEFPWGEQVPYSPLGHYNRPDDDLNADLSNHQHPMNNDIE